MEQLERCRYASDLHSGTRFSHTRPHLIVLNALLACVLTLGAVPRAGASPRLWQPLLIKGAQLHPLLDTRVDRLEVLAIHRGKLEPIPFQIDAVLPNGVFVLPQGPFPSTGKWVPTVGLSDELVVMMFDLGDRAAPAGLPDDALEIAVTDPLGGPERYAYIAATRHPRLSPVRYVDYDPQSEQIETDHYRLGFKHELPDDFRLQDRRGQQTRNLISGFELRGEVTLLRLITLKLTENDIDSSLLAYRCGPVRVIRRLGHRIRVLPGIQSPQVSTIEFFYRDFAQAPFTMRLPLRRLLHDIQGRIAMEFLNLDGFSVLAEGLESPIEIRDRADLHPITQLSSAPMADWLAVRGDGRLMMQTFVPSHDLSLIQRRLYVNPLVPDVHHNPQAAPAAVGIQTTGWERLSKGPHRFDPLLISVPESYGAKRVIDEASAVPIVTVQPVAKSGLPPAARGLISRAPASFSEEGK